MYKNMFIYFFLNNFDPLPLEKCPGTPMSQNQIFHNQTNKCFPPPSPCGLLYCSAVFYTITCDRMCVHVLGAELLQDGKTASGRRDVRVGVQRRSGVLGRGRAVPGVVLPAQVPPAQGARARGDAQGGGIVATARRGRVR